MKLSPPLPALALALAAAAAIAPASAQVLFSDDFSTSGQSNDVNFESGAGRQSGTLGPITYRQGVGDIGAAITGSTGDESFGGYQTQIGNAGGPGKLWLVGAGSAGDGDQVALVSPDFNFNLATGVGGYLSISFDLDPVIGAAGTDDDWGAITFGASDNASFGTSGSGARGQTILSTAANFGVLFRDNGQYQAFSDGSMIEGGTYSLTPTITTTHAIELRITGLGDGNAFDGSGDAQIDLYADGMLATTLTRAGGFADNYLTLHGYSGGFKINAFDNLQVTAVAAVPEPSTVALLLGSAALLIAAARRRQGRTG